MRISSQTFTHNLHNRGEKDKAKQSEIQIERERDSESQQSTASHQQRLSLFTYDRREMIERRKEINTKAGVTKQEDGE